MCGCEPMILLYIFLTWLIGLPILLLIDAYVRGRYDKTIFAFKSEEGKNYTHNKSSDEWDRGASIFIWPIYYMCMAIYYTFTGASYIIKNGMTDAMSYFEKKGKQANDVDYQAEKHLLRK